MSCVLDATCISPGQPITSISSQLHAQSHEWLKIDHGGSMYTTETGEHCKSEDLGVGAVRRLLIILLRGGEHREVKTLKLIKYYSFCN